jgi:hypothetical protein
LLGKIDGVGFCYVSRLKKPSTEASLDDVDCIAGYVYPSLRQQDFVVTDAKVSKNRAIHRCLAEAARWNSGNFGRKLHDHSYVGYVQPESRHCAYDALSSDCGCFDGSTIAKNLE